MAVKKLTKALLAALTLFAAPAFSEIAAMDNVNVTRILTSETRFGGCMVELSKPIGTVLPRCQRNLVSFSCNGDLGNSRSLASTNLQTAQLALVTGYEVRIIMRDDKTIDGFCYAQEISVRAPAQ